MPISWLTRLIRADFNQQNEQLMAMMETMANVSHATNETCNEPPEQSVNATTTNVNQEILQLLRTIQQQMTNGQGVNGGNGTNGGTGANGSGRRGRNRRTPDNASFNRRVRDKYCWTHGGCNHCSSKCSRKAPGHRDEATFDNRMGGSNAFCP